MGIVGSLVGGTLGALIVLWAWRQWGGRRAAV